MRVRACVRLLTRFFDSLSAYHRGTSSSSRTYSTSELETDRFMFENKDFVAVFSAGNLGQFGPGSVTAPATAKNVIAVGETGNSGMCIRAQHTTHIHT